VRGEGCWHDAVVGVTTLCWVHGVVFRVGRAAVTSNKLRPRYMCLGRSQSTDGRGFLAGNSGQAPNGTRFLEFFRFEPGQVDSATMKGLRDLLAGRRNLHCVVN